MRQVYLRVVWKTGGPSTADLGWARTVSAPLAAAPILLAIAYLRTAADFPLGRFAEADAERVRREGEKRGLCIIEEGEYSETYVEAALECEPQTRDEIRAILFPAFDPEGSISARRSGNAWNVDVRAAKEQFWATRFSVLPFDAWERCPRNPGIQVTTAAAKAADAFRFGEILAVHDEVFARPKPTQGSDGMRISIRAQFPDRAFAGEVWSPGPGSPEHALTAALIELARSSVSDEGLHSWLDRVSHYLS
jgi:hypothetical protein